MAIAVLAVIKNGCVRGEMAMSCRQVQSLRMDRALFKPTPMLTELLLCLRHLSSVAMTGGVLDIGASLVEAAFYRFWPSCLKST